jgi:hypothetical protein
LLSTLNKYGARTLIDTSSGHLDFFIKQQDLPCGMSFLIHLQQLTSLSHVLSLTYVKEVLPLGKADFPLAFNLVNKITMNLHNLNIFNIMSLKESFEELQLIVFDAFCRFESNIEESQQNQAAKHTNKGKQTSITAKSMKNANGNAKDKGNNSFSIDMPSREQNAQIDMASNSLNLMKYGEY